MRKKKVIISVNTLAVIISTILFSLAYRYLIEREETPVSANTSVNISESLNQTEKNNAKYDDWNYVRDGLEIEINKVESGSGLDKIIKKSELYPYNLLFLLCMIFY